MISGVFITIALAAIYASRRYLVRATVAWALATGVGTRPLTDRTKQYLGRVTVPLVLSEIVAIAAILAAGVYMS